MSLMPKLSINLTEPIERFDHELIKPIPTKEFVKQTKVQAREDAKQAKIQAREDAKQAKIQAREDAKQAKIQEREFKILRKARVKRILLQYKIQRKKTAIIFAKQAKIQARERRLQERAELHARWVQERIERHQAERQRIREERITRERHNRRRSREREQALISARDILNRPLPNPNDDRYQLQLLERHAALALIHPPVSVGHYHSTTRPPHQEPARLCNAQYRQLVNRDKLNATKKQEQLICVDTVYEQEECPICFDSIGKTNNMILRCGHQACGDCIFRHFQTVGGTKCPVCREQITVRINGWNPPNQVR